MSILPDTNDLVVSAAKFLIEGGDDTLAAAMLSCTVTAFYTERAYRDNYGVDRYHAFLELRGPRAAYDLLNQFGHFINAMDLDEFAEPVPNPGERVKAAIAALLPHDCTLTEYAVRAEVVTAAPTARGDLLELVHGKAIHNQAISAEQPIIWAGLRFRSEPERRIARAFDAAGVLFFPNAWGA